MTEAEMTGVTEEAAAPIAEDMGGAQVEQQPETTTEVRPESDQEINFRKLRESTEQLRQENEEQRAMMRAMQEELEKRMQSSPKEEDEFASLDPSDWLTVEQSQKLAAKIADARFDEKWKEYEAKRRQEELPMRIKQKFSDFDDVVTEENVKQLQALEPDVARALSTIGDEEAKAVAAYKYIKAFVPQAAESTANKAKLQQNASQPKSLSAMGGKSPLSQANAFEQGLTPQLKKQLYAEMNACARQA